MSKRTFEDGESSGLPTKIKDFKFSAEAFASNGKRQKNDGNKTSSSSEDEDESCEFDASKHHYPPRDYSNDPSDRYVILKKTSTHTDHAILFDKKTQVMVKEDVTIKTNIWRPYN